MVVPGFWGFQASWANEGAALPPMKMPARVVRLRPSTTAQRAFAGLQLAKPPPHLCRRRHPRPGQAFPARNFSSSVISLPLTAPTAASGVSQVAMLALRSNR